MNLERKYNEEEEKAINMSREMAGLPPITQDNENITVENKEVKNEAATIEAIATEETAEEVKKRRNEAERRRIKQQGGLRPRQIFKHTLVDWDGKPKDVICTYPTTKQASKYSKMDFDPVTGKGVLDFGDIVDCFYNDDLLPRFNIEDFPSSEIIGLGVFLLEVVRNPFLK
ncbi:hypothetical protein JMUB3936_p1038 (plasmid) [Leptotrichia wadei]|uniref:Uncharacterized protein n=1 Tax=Leptotrichia wadei TaxID=157687 RepID=A0A510KWJ3_9FUSO|nr:hypothetical protein [Leptotrichia wadei]BBM55966.1 hypothetical protein JMUB3936_p1038 [Leptotrichia wadei]